MKILIFGGTTEGKRISELLSKEGHEVTVSVATPEGEEEQGTAPGIRILTGRKEEGEMEELMKGFSLSIDATHPFAEEVSRNIRKASLRAGIRNIRILRESAAPGYEGIRWAASSEEAAEMAGKMGGRVLLTTGVKDLPVFAKRIQPERLYPRVLPLTDSITACEEAGIPHRNIIAGMGPFSAEFNEVCIRDLGAAILVTKESGPAGGFPEKILACERTGIPVIVIRRPEEMGMTLEGALRYIREGAI